MYEKIPNLLTLNLKNEKHSYYRNQQGNWV